LKAGGGASGPSKHYNNAPYVKIEAAYGYKQGVELPHSSGQQGQGSNNSNNF